VYIILVLQLIFSSKTNDVLLFYSHINGITTGVMHVLKSCALKVIRNSVTNYSTQQNINETFNFTYFKARYNTKN